MSTCILSEMATETLTVRHEGVSIEDMRISLLHVWSGSGRALHDTWYAYQENVGGGVFIRAKLADL